VLIFLADGVLRIQPPLVISKEELKAAIDIIEDAMQEYIDGQIPDDVLQAATGW
jgi:4-aminobutyrate aminotransferase